MAELKTNVLYFGDNLEVLRKHIPDESIDLIYLDPPFNSNRSYNVLFKETPSTASQAQIEAFEDTWHWGKVAQDAFEQIALRGGDDTAKLLTAMVDALGHNDVTAYLTMMAIRLVELRRGHLAAGLSTDSNRHGRRAASGQAGEDATSGIAFRAGDARAPARGRAGWDGAVTRHD